MVIRAVGIRIIAAEFPLEDVGRRRWRRVSVFRLLPRFHHVLMLLSAIA
jgi:hypothetical protein